MLDREYKFFQTNEPELRQRYAGKVIVIVGEEVVGAFSDYNSALIDAAKRFDEGTFLIQDLKADPTVQRFHSRVYV